MPLPPPIPACALLAVPQAAVSEAERLGTSGPDLTRYFLVCAALLGLVGALAFVTRRYLAGHLRRRAAARSLQVVDVLPLGGRQKLCVVRCYDRTFLLGLGDKEVRSIAELDAEPAVVPAPRHAAEGERSPEPFGERLAAELGGGDAAAPEVHRTRAPWRGREGVLG